MDFDKNIFINCPCDNEYIDNLLKPMLYIIIQNGLNPCLSIALSDSSEIRLNKITKIIEKCKYSIHDLSKVKAEKEGDYARMNMPFELGIDYGVKIMGGEKMKKKQFLILEAVKYDYMKALSDINGIDVKVHKNKTQGVFDCLYAWISETLKIKNQTPSLKTFYGYTDFMTNFFEAKTKEFGSEKYASDYITNISISDYIYELKINKLVD